ncbi:hypothetical protein J5N97_015711 [Dioscorea zingiberensis]|uniref:FRIGIDA-like protein n=1 Tax=Dioscorea zingiberensis TaxID=325984 RepID=A0A9D5CI19_9LILI|nr:hypothetical protein J5N97_015711 [Dioscorea zingiberensis]
MAKSGKVSVCIDSTTEMAAQLVRALDELDSYGDVSQQSKKSPWDGMKENLHGLQKSFEKIFGQLEEKENAFEEMKSEIQEYLAERETVVVAKERALLDRLQEMKDSTVSALVEACKKHKVASPVPLKREVDTSNHSNPHASIPDNKSDKLAEARDIEDIKLHELKRFCKLMDAEGVIRFMTNKQKHFTAYREELSIALKCAPEPASLVLNSLERLLFPSVPSNSLSKNKKASQVAKFRFSLVLMEAVVPILQKIDRDRDRDHRNSEIKGQAMAIAYKWRAILGDVDINAPYVSKLEVETFIQLLVTFSIEAEFDEIDLCRLVLAISHSRQAPVLCKSLGLTHRVPGVVEALVDGDKQIAAIHFIHAFNLTKSFPPVPLLKDYLKGVRRKAQAKTLANGATGVQRITPSSTSTLVEIRRQVIVSIPSRAPATKSSAIAMARALRRAFCAAVVLLLSVGVANAEAVRDLNARTLPGGGAVLPLELFPGNSTRLPVSAVRRQLHGHPTSSAHMRLYDDLLTNG